MNLEIRNPRTGKLDYQVQVTTEDLVAQTSREMRNSGRDWHALSIVERGSRLERLAAIIEQRSPLIAQALESDTGRRRIARDEVAGVTNAIRAWVSRAPTLVSDKWVRSNLMPSVRHAPQFTPYELVGVISPWNFPLVLSLIDTVPALLAGCCVLVKPSEVTPRFVAPLTEAIEEAELGHVLKFLQGNGTTGAALIDNVDAICFTGSVPTGRKVAAAAASNMIPAFLELGGKDPLIILEGADLDLATDAALRGSVLASGQACQSVERIYVAAPIRDAFTAKLTDKAESLRLNWPKVDSGEIGPIIYEEQANVLTTHIEDAVIKGAIIETGGVIEHHGGGLWLRPTVLTNVTHDMLVMREETFGPIMPIMSFDTVEHAITLANDTRFGLSAAVFGENVEAAEAVGRQIDAGAISINDAALTAFVHDAEKHSFKLSGLGASRMGLAGFHRFLRRKALIANTDAPAPMSAFSEDG